MKRTFLFYIIPLWMVANVVLAQDISRSDFFEFKRIWFYEKAIRAALLNNGIVVFYFEETRPVTEEEKEKRSQEFERQWRELEKKDKDFANRVIPSSRTTFISEIFKWLLTDVMKNAYPLAENAFVNTPVVTKAGFIFILRDGTQIEVPVDLEKEYGFETWQRMAGLGINIRISADNRFVALEREKGGIMLYVLRNGAVTPLGIFDGMYPFGFSLDGERMFVTLGKGLYRVIYLPSKDGPIPYVDYIPFVPGILSEVVRIDIGKDISITDVLLASKYLVVLTSKEIIFYDLEKNTIVHTLSLNKSGGRSILASSDQEVFVAEMDGTLAKIDLRDMRSYDFKMNHFDLLRDHRVYFHKLVSISPDKRFIAALYDPGLILPEGSKSWSGSTRGESRLFIWDLVKGKVVWQLEKRLEGITGGFGYQSPVYFSKDWSHLLLNLKDDGLELWQFKIKDIL